MPTGLLLPFRFDPALLKADLARVQPEEWVPHYNEQDYGGVWRGVALRSANGSAGHLFAEGPVESFADTPLLDRCPYFREVVAAFRFPVRSVRLLSLAPGSFIREHCDLTLGYEDGEIRIHVPIQTNPGVEFYTCGERVLLEEGRSYYVNVGLPHRVNNRGETDRIHLVIDGVVDEWVHELFRTGEAEGWTIPQCPAPCAVDEFRRSLLRDASLRDALRPITWRHDFEEAAVKMGRDAGLDFNEADVDAVLRGRPLDATAGVASPVSGWTPIRAVFRDGVPFAEWIPTEERRLDEPFFEDSVRVFLREPLTSFLRCEWPLRIMEPMESAGTATAPSGFIFHMSRCGSTLVSRMLAAVPSISAVSEADCIDQVIQAKLALPELAEDEHARWVRWMIAALGQGRAAGQSRYFVKLDAWHIHKLPLVRAAFPHVPWIFVYRHPLEVLVSHQRAPGRQTLPGGMDPRAVGLETADITRIPRQEWAARVIAGFLRSALAFRNEPNGLFIDYQQLPEAVTGPIAAHFGLTLTDADRALMLESTRLHAKNPWFLFEADTEKKQAEAQWGTRQMAAELEPLYWALKARSRTPE